MQLPTGSCVLKPADTTNPPTSRSQLPTGSCVLKHNTPDKIDWRVPQLPTGSCVLKQCLLWGSRKTLKAATYG